MKKPNFLIIGAMKSGSTSLYRYLNQHPDVYMSPVKEPHFFSSKNPQFTSWNSYLSLFKGASHEKAIGEASTTYITSPEAAQRIKESMPNAKLIAILRNPVEASYSLYLMKNRDRLSSMSSEEILQEFNHVVENSGEYGITRGRFYYPQVSCYFDIFGKENVKILLYDALREDPSSMLRGVFEYLEVDSNFAIDTSEKHNLGGIPTNSFLYRFLERLKSNQRLIGLIPKNLYGPLYQFYLSLRKGNRFKPPELPDDIRQKLLDLYREDVVSLQTLTGLNLNSWLS